ncbi:IPP transferase-domain-containing protein [Dichotomocladium elegans]|nr:IPP transferase-domain-containing protein [Dichotomocladium elegans]
MHKITAVIGTTGVGKSQLAVEICKALKGQVINADSMQVYKGLDVITNKMPIHERLNVPHHLMDFLNPEEEYKVLDFKRDAIHWIEKLSLEDQLPVVVGGTNYYVQSLLWHNSLVKELGHTENEMKQKLPADLDSLETHELLTRLKEVDPIMGNRWHPSDRRKILRSLQIYYETGRPQSEILKEQQAEHEKHGMQARFKSLIFWLYANPTTLNSRLDERVDKMIETGLFDEIQSLRKRVVNGQVKLPGQDLEMYQRGLWQAIGYKEFDPYFTAVEQQQNQNTGEPMHSPEDLDRIRLECTEKMKSATRRYAKRQVQWIRNKLLPAVAKTDDVQVFLLDATDLDAWDTNVRETAIRIAEDSPLPDPKSLSALAASMLSVTPQLDPQTRALTWQQHSCPVCKSSDGLPLILNGELAWKQHVSSRFHRKALKRQCPPNSYMEEKKVKTNHVEDDAAGGDS